jgi:hypothetical protein
MECRGLFPICVGLGRREAQRRGLGMARFPNTKKKRLNRRQSSRVQVKKPSIDNFLATCAKREAGVDCRLASRSLFSGCEGWIEVATGLTRKLISVTKSWTVPHSYGNIRIVEWVGDDVL